MKLSSSVNGGLLFTFAFSLNWNCKLNILIFGNEVSSCTPFSRLSWSKRKNTKCSFWLCARYFLTIWNLFIEILFIWWCNYRLPSLSNKISQAAEEAQRKAEQQRAEAIAEKAALAQEMVDLFHFRSDNIWIQEKMEKKQALAMEARQAEVYLLCALYCSHFRISNADETAARTKRGRASVILTHSLNVLFFC